MKKHFVMFFLLTFILIVIVGVVIYVYSEITIGSSENYIGNIFSGGMVAGSRDELYYMETHEGEIGLYCSNAALTKTKKNM